jgi:hypothetical protein
VFGHERVELRVFEQSNLPDLLQRRGFSRDLAAIDRQEPNAGRLLAAEKHAANCTLERRRFSAAVQGNQCRRDALAIGARQSG